jgi:hypothetical protein
MKKIGLSSGGESMKCHHLTGSKVQICRGSQGMYVPSLFELEEYCQTAKSARCPLLPRDAGAGHSTNQDGIDARFPGIEPEAMKIYAVVSGEKTDC